MSSYIFIEDSDSEEKQRSLKSPKSKSFTTTSTPTTPISGSALSSIPASTAPLSKRTPSSSKRIKGKVSLNATVETSDQENHPGPSNASNLALNPQSSPNSKPSIIDISFENNKALTEDLYKRDLPDEMTKDLKPPVLSKMIESNPTSPLSTESLYRVGSSYYISSEGIKARDSSSPIKSSLIVSPESAKRKEPSSLKSRASLLFDDLNEERMTKESSTSSSSSSYIENILNANELRLEEIPIGVQINTTDSISSDAQQSPIKPITTYKHLHSLALEGNDERTKSPNAKAMRKSLIKRVSFAPNIQVQELSLDNIESDKSKEEDSSWYNSVEIEEDSPIETVVNSIEEDELSYERVTESLPRTPPRFLSDISLTETPVSERKSTITSISSLFETPKAEPEPPMLPLTSTKPKDSNTIVELKGTRSSITFKNQDILSKTPTFTLTTKINSSPLPVRPLSEKPTSRKKSNLFEREEATLKETITKRLNHKEDKYKKLAPFMEDLSDTDSSKLSMPLEEKDSVILLDTKTTKKMENENLTLIKSKKLVQQRSKDLFDERLNSMIDDEDEDISMDTILYSKESREFSRIESTHLPDSIKGTNFSTNENSENSGMDSEIDEPDEIMSVFACEASELLELDSQNPLQVYDEDNEAHMSDKVTDAQYNFSLTTTCQQETLDDDSTGIKLSSIQNDKDNDSKIYSLNELDALSSTTLKNTTEYDDIMGNNNDISAISMMVSEKTNIDIPKENTSIMGSLYDKILEEINYREFDLSVIQPEIEQASTSVSSFIAGRVSMNNIEAATDINENSIEIEDSLENLADLIVIKEDPVESETCEQFFKGLLEEDFVYDTASKSSPTKNQEGAFTQAVIANDPISINATQIETGIISESNLVSETSTIHHETILQTSHVFDGDEPEHSINVPSPNMDEGRTIVTSNDDSIITADKFFEFESTPKPKKNGPLDEHVNIDFLKSQTHSNDDIKDIENRKMNISTPSLNLFELREELIKEDANMKSEPDQMDNQMPFIHGSLESNLESDALRTPNSMVSGLAIHAAQYSVPHNEGLGMDLLPSLQNEHTNIHAIQNMGIKNEYPLSHNEDRDTLFDMEKSFNKIHGMMEMYPSQYIQTGESDLKDEALKLDKIDIKGLDLTTTACTLDPADQLKGNDHDHLRCAEETAVTLESVSNVGSELKEEKTDVNGIEFIATKTHEIPFKTPNKTNQKLDVLLSPASTRTPNPKKNIKTIDINEIFTSPPTTKVLDGTPGIPGVLKTTPIIPSGKSYKVKTVLWKPSLSPIPKQEPRENDENNDNIVNSEFSTPKSTWKDYKESVYNKLVTLTGGKSAKVLLASKSNLEKRNGNSTTKRSISFIQDTQLPDFIDEFSDSPLATKRFKPSSEFSRPSFPNPSLRASIMFTPIKDEDSQVTRKTSIDEFLQLIGIKFMNDMSLPARRDTLSRPKSLGLRIRSRTNNTILGMEVYSAEKAVKSLLVTQPKIEIYKQGSHVVLTRIQEVSGKLEQDEIKFAYNPPPIYYLFINARQDEKARIIQKLKLAKACCRMKVEQNWYQWRTSQLIPYREILKENLAKLQEDQRLFMNATIKLETLSQDLKEVTKTTQHQTFQKEKQIEAIKNMDWEKYNSLKRAREENCEKIADLKRQVSEKIQATERMQAELKAKKEKREALGKELNTLETQFNSMTVVTKEDVEAEKLQYHLYCKIFNLKPLVLKGGCVELKCKWSDFDFVLDAKLVDAMNKQFKVDLTPLCDSVLFKKYIEQLLPSTMDEYSVSSKLAHMLAFIRTQLSKLRELENEIKSLRSTFNIQVEDQFSNENSNFNAKNALPLTITFYHPEKYTKWTLQLYLFNDLRGNFYPNGKLIAKLVNDSHHHSHSTSQAAIDHTLKAFLGKPIRLSEICNALNLV